MLYKHHVPGALKSVKIPGLFGQTREEEDQLLALRIVSTHDARAGSGPHGLDRKSVLIGEAKWPAKESEAKRWAEDLRARAEAAPFVKGRKVVFALWLKKPLAGAIAVAVITPDAVLKALR
jgi:hypothetical protein